MPAAASTPPTPNTGEPRRPGAPGEPPAGAAPHAPAAQHLAAPVVLAEMARFGRGRVAELTPGRALVLTVLGGGFITVGALFSVLLSADVDAHGPKLLLEGFGFSAGFFFVVLSEAVLFTEANVVLPTAQLCPPDTLAALGDVIEHKLAYREAGGVGAWSQFVLSGVLANWLVGMAAFFAFMGHTIIGTYVRCSWR
jgi:formate transporter